MWALLDPSHPVFSAAVELLTWHRIPDDVIHYIHDNSLYRELDLAGGSKGKEKADATAGPSSS